MRWNPKTPESGLSVFPLFLPYFLHYLIGDIPRWLRPNHRRPLCFQRRREHSPSHQSPFLLGVTFQVAGNDARHRLVPVADQYLLAVLHALQMGAETRLEVADIHRAHVSILSNMTTIVILVFVRPSPDRPDSPWPSHSAY